MIFIVLAIAWIGSGWLGFALMNGYFIGRFGARAGFCYFRLVADIFGGFLVFLGELFSYALLCREYGSWFKPIFLPVSEPKQ